MHKLPKSVKLEFIAPNWTLKTTVPDNRFVSPWAILASGTAPDKKTAKKLAWEACEEMGLVNDE